MLRQMTAPLFGLIVALILLRADTAWAQTRQQGMDTDELGNLKRSVDEMRPEPRRRGRTSEERGPKRSEARPPRREKRSRPSETRMTARDRQRQCGIEWREARAAGEMSPRMTWPRFWSQCNARLKRAG